MSKENMVKALRHHADVKKLVGDNYYSEVKARVVNDLAPSDKQLYKDFHSDPVGESLSPVKKIGDKYVQNEAYKFNDMRKSKLIENIRESTAEAHRQGLDSASSFLQNSKPRPDLSIANKENLTGVRDLLLLGLVESLRPSVAGEGSDVIPERDAYDKIRKNLMMKGINK